MDLDTLAFTLYIKADSMEQRMLGIPGYLEKYKFKQIMILVIGYQNKYFW